jgi:uncharacterized protein YdbL (DUF1318 family)
MTRILFAIAALALGATAASAAESCADQAKTKKLAGAALTSFLTKCEKDATAACEKASTDKKLAGAAKASADKKCIADAVGKKA